MHLTFYPLVSLLMKLNYKIIFTLKDVIFQERIIKNVIGEGFL
jgi:hypothetical protein